jgi:hypothetical protein
VAMSLRPHSPTFMAANYESAVDPSRQACWIQDDVLEEARFFWSWLRGTQWNQIHFSEVRNSTGALHRCAGVR